MLRRMITTGAHEQRHACSDLARSASKPNKRPSDAQRTQTTAAGGRGAAADRYALLGRALTVPLSVEIGSGAAA
eukprot:6206866-Pleurochrysis_carterae.AAC.1